MLKSKIAPIIVAIVLVLGAVCWAWTISSIDYTKMKGSPDPAAAQEQGQKP